MKRMLSFLDMSSEAGGECPDDRAADSGVSGDQSKSRKSKKGRITTEDQVISQTADRTNAAAPITPIASAAPHADELLCHLKQQQIIINSLEQKVDHLTSQLQRICDFLGLSSAESEPSSKQTMDIDAPVDELTVIDAEPACDATVAGIKSQRHKSIANEQPRNADNKTIKDIVFDAIYKENNDRVKRAKTVILTGVQESAQTCDNDTVRLLLCSEFDFEPSNISCRRLGTKSTGYTQPLLVTLPSAEDAAWLVANAKQLRKSRDQWTKNNIYINRNLSPAEQRTLYEQRCRRRAKKSDDKQDSQATRDGLTTTDSQRQPVNGMAGRGQPIRVVVNSRLQSDRTSINPDSAWRSSTVIDTVRLHDISEFPPLVQGSGPSAATAISNTVTADTVIQSSADQITGDVVGGRQ